MRIWVGAKMRLAATVGLAVVFFILGLSAASAAVSQGSHVIVKKFSNQCTYVRAAVDNVDKIAISRVKNRARAYPFACDPANPVLSAPTGYLGAGAVLMNAKTETICGGAGPIYTSSNSGSKTVKVHHVGGTGCAKSAGHPYETWAQGWRWVPDSSSWASESTRSPRLNFN